MSSLLFSLLVLVGRDVEPLQVLGELVLELYPDGVGRPGKHGLVGLKVNLGERSTLFTKLANFLNFIFITCSLSGNSSIRSTFSLLFMVLLVMVMFLEWKTTKWVSSVTWKMSFSMPEKKSRK